MTGGPNRIQLKRTKGWKMPEGAVKVDRSTVFGNPYPTIEEGPWDQRRTAAEAVDAYRRHLNSSPGLQEIALRKLRGRSLACWCHPDQPCHADVLLKFVNR